jgi:hypothetical protein
MSTMEMTKKRFWFFPWNRTSAHWTCYLVDLEEKRVIFFNPHFSQDEICLHPWLPICNQEPFKNRLLEVVAKRFKKEKITFVLEDWTAWNYHPREMRLQRDDANCGIYVILWMRAILYRPIFDGELDFTADHGDVVRHKLLHILQCFSVVVARKQR